MADPVLKLFIDPKSQRVIFAEAEKDFVDFLFHLLSLPLLSLSNLVFDQVVVLDNLCKSIENLGSNYVHEAMDKNIILKPEAPIWAAKTPFLMLKKPDSKYLYGCQKCEGQLQDYSFDKCRNCASTMIGQMWYSPLNQKCHGVGFVKGSVVYMVTDDLVVKPLTTLNTIDLLQKFDLKHMTDLQQKEVKMRKNEALKLLKACMNSTSILTDIFLDPEYENKNATVSAKS